MSNTPRREQGTREYEALMGTAPADTLAQLRDRAPLIYDTLIESMFAGPLSRPELGRTQRELATVAVLAALGGAERQLATHTRAALQLGLHPSELLALCEHVAAYAGFPRALNAVAVVDEVARDAGHPRPPRLRHIALEDHETVVAEAGESGPPVLLVHALGLDWRMWEPVMSELATGRRVFAYDIRGHGHAAGSPVPFTMDDTAADLVGVLDALGLERAHVVGLSYGGGIAQTAAVRHPERFASLALLATTDFPFTDAFETRARSGEVERDARAGRTVADALVHAGGAGARRLGRPLRPRAGTARHRHRLGCGLARVQGPRRPGPAGRVRASGARPGGRVRRLHDAGDHGRHPPPHPRLDVHSAAGHAAHADARAARAGQRGPRRLPALSAGSPASADASCSGASSAMWWPESIRAPCSGPSTHARQIASGSP